jgi:hypothetical protein
MVRLKPAPDVTYSLSAPDTRPPFLPKTPLLCHDSLERSLVKSDSEWLLVVRLGHSVTGPKPCVPLLTCTI